VESRKIGLLFGSFGDVESCECVEHYCTNALTTLANFEIPEPAFAKKYVGELIWKAGKKETMEMYKSISPSCNTSFQTNARAQANAVGSILDSMLPEEDRVSVFTGYNFVSGEGCPLNVTVVDQARMALNAGMDILLMVNQNNAQQSNTTNGVSYEQLSNVIQSEESAWKDMDVLGLDDYSQLQEFNELLVDYTEKQFNMLLPNVSESDVCLLFACHGNPSRLAKQGDPAESYMRQNYAYLEKHFLSRGFFDVSLAFQNHGGKGAPFPQNLFSWSSPPDTTVVPQIAEKSCTHVMISGAISFVLDNSETLFDERIDDIRMLGGKKEKVVVSPMFNADQAFAKFLAGVLSESLSNPSTLRDVKKYGL